MGIFFAKMTLKNGKGFEGQAAHPRPNQMWVSPGLWACIFFGRGVPNLQKIGINKTATPYFGNKNCMTPHHRYTLPAKLYWN